MVIKGSKRYLIVPALLFARCFTFASSSLVFKVLKGLEVKRLNERDQQKKQIVVIIIINKLLDSY